MPLGEVMRELVRRCPERDDECEIEQKLERRRGSVILVRVAARQSPTTMRAVGQSSVTRRRGCDVILGRDVFHADHSLGRWVCSTSSRTQVARLEEGPSSSYGSHTRRARFALVALFPLAGYVVLRRAA